MVLILLFHEKTPIIDINVQIFKLTRRFIDEGVKSYWNKLAICSTDNLADKLPVEVRNYQSLNELATW